MTYKSKEECRDNVLQSLRTGSLLIVEVRFLVEHFQELEEYECCQGAIEALNQYQKELDEYGDKIFTGNS
jgi:hypothetical protein